MSDNKLIEVPEYVVTKAAEYSGANSSFQRMLATSEEYRAANLTPMFLYDYDKMLLYCFCKETYGKKLH